MCWFKYFHCLETQVKFENNKSYLCHCLTIFWRSSLKLTKCLVGRSFLFPFCTILISILLFYSLCLLCEMYRSYENERRISIWPKLWVLQLMHWFLTFTASLEHGVCAVVCKTAVIGTTCALWNEISLHGTSGLNTLTFLTDLAETPTYLLCVVHFSALISWKDSAPGRLRGDNSAKWKKKTKLSSLYFFFLLTSKFSAK